MLVAPHDVSRVIARPFVGHAGAYARTANRRDFSHRAARTRRCSTRSRAAGVPRAGVGKVDDLFAGRGLARAAHGEQRRGHRGHPGVASAASQGGLLFANLVDFDQLYGHRNDAAGF